MLTNTTNKLDRLAKELKENLIALHNPPFYSMIDEQYALEDDKEDTLSFLKSH